jgi:hypothetical protein
MSFEQMYPHTEPMESKIKLLLVMRGYNRKDIHFRNGSDGRYIRNAYWKHIDGEDINYVMNICKIGINETCFFDEDCGWKYSYHIKNSVIS